MEQAKEKSEYKITKYPLLFVHGMGLRDYRHINSWGRIPKTLRENGFTVFHGMQDGNGSVEDNAAVLKESVLSVLAQTGCEKVNIIAHSKGGLDSRYMITHLGLADKVASLTTVATPHHGSQTVDRLLRFPAPLVKFGCAITDLFMRLLGDKKPRTYAVIRHFKTDVMKEFNAKTPDAPQVYYRSYAFTMQHWYSDILLWLPHLVVRHIEGENDGLLPPKAVKWGEFMGVYRGSGRKGVSHYDEVDLHRRRLSIQTGSQTADILQFYLDLAKSLADQGF